MSILFFLLLIFAVLAVAILREPELRRRVSAAVLRGQGAARAAFGLFQPRDIQRQALALIKQEALVSIGFAHLPTDVKVFVNPLDFDTLGDTHSHVCAELGEEMAALKGTSAGGEATYVLAAEPRVTLGPDQTLSRGTVRVDAAWLEGTIAATVMRREAEPFPTGPHAVVEVEGEDSCVVPLKGRMTVGRDPGSDIAINHLSVSRAHAVLTVDDTGRVQIADVGSRNGVEVEGRRVGTAESPMPVAPGQSIRLSKRVRLDLLADDAGSLAPTEGMAPNG